jgi:hypothetical protein
VDARRGRLPHRLQELDGASHFHGIVGKQFHKDGVGHRVIRFDNGYRFVRQVFSGPGFLPAQGEVRDIDVIAAQHRSDVTDHAW